LSCNSFKPGVRDYGCGNFSTGKIDPIASAKFLNEETIFASSKRRLKI
jgi:hypothetical protein